VRPLGDFHIHTVASGHAYSTLSEIISHAKSIGIKYVGIADHGPKMLDGPHPFYFSNMSVIPKEINGINIKKGIEINILDEHGNIDFDEDAFKKLDYAIASFHEVIGPLGLSPEKYLNIYEKVVVKPYVKVIGHPGNPKFPVLIPEFVALCKENHVAIEINNSSFIHTRKGSYDNCFRIAQEAKRQNADLLLSSDAHIHYDVANFSSALDLLAKAEIPEQLIVNFNKEKIESYFDKKW